MFDVFYTNQKPNLFPFEKQATNLEDAAKQSRTKFFWFLDGHNNYTNFDFEWQPAPWESHHVHVWPSQWYEYGGVYFANKDTLANYEWNFHTEIVCTLPSRDNWTIHYPIREDLFDFSWVPHPKDPPYNYVFGNQWFPGTKMPTAEYKVPGAMETKYMEMQAILCYDYTNWQSLYPVAMFDYSWVPDPQDPPYIYIFGNQHYPGTIMPTVKYIVPGATEEKFVEFPIVTLSESRTNWSIPEEVDASAIDFSWVPHPKDAPYVHHFGSEFQMSMGLTYTVPGATEPKFEGEPPLLAKERKAVQVLDIFYLDKSNFSSADRYRKLLEKCPNAQKIRYVNSNLETIQRCIAKAKTSKFWVISSENVYDDFNFEWHAQPWQSYMTHVFGSQWEKWSDTFLVNKWEFERHTKWAKTLAEFPNLNFVKDQYVKTGNDNFDMYFVDHGNTDDSLLSLKSRYPRIKVTRFVDNLLDALRRIMNSTTSEYVWVTSSLCNYGMFDFTWTPEPWQAEMIHCFGSPAVKRGDTFYIHVESFKKQMTDLELLDWFNVICYHEDVTLSRFDCPVVYYDTDNLIEVINNHQFTAPYTTFTNVKGYTPQLEQCLWSQRDRKVMSATPDNGVACVPRDIKQYLKTQIYDYPYIDKQWNRALSALPMDVIFISNGEPMADANYAKLVAQYPMAKRSDGVLGREAAYKAAAAMSSTHWFYAVFAKTEVLSDFDFSFQPDYFQEPKHYIFHSRNALNGLEYGAMNINLYNKKLVLNTQPGLDFTLSAAHEVVPICASISRFNDDPWITWRSAFREVLKLKREVDLAGRIEIAHRLKVWCTKAEGENAEHCLQGANDALEFYTSVNGDYEKLKLSFDWAWLQQYYESKYNQTPWIKT